MNLLEALKERILIGDGAMGTLLYSYGVDRCFEELCLTHPDQVLNVHRAYIEAGADVIQTNTYGANYIKLARYGLEEQVKQINEAAVKLAREAAGDKAFVVGTIGGIHGTQSLLGSKEEIKRSFREQLYCLLMEKVDGIMLETYYDLDELIMVLDIAREITDIPIIANVSMHEAGNMENGMPLAKALQELEKHGADVVGINCRLGPYHMVRSLEEVPLLDHAFLAAYPNASLPAYSEGKLEYVNHPDYFRRCAQDFRDEGVRLIGGCCGTTPEHIRALVEAVRGVAPLAEKQVEERPHPVAIREKRSKKEEPLHEIAKKRHSVIVELDTPKHLHIEEYLDGVRALKKVGVDAITLADNSLASPRICNAAMANLVRHECDMRPLVHLTCRDRNLIGLQSHLMGLHTSGMHDILAITGDPTKIGDFPGATSVFDVTSFELIKLIKQFNEGTSFSGKSLQKSTNFSVSAAFNPNVKNMEQAVKRLERKISFGADYFLTQPVYSKETIIELANATKHIEEPIYIGIMPLTSTRNAEFLHNEVPGIKLTDDVRDRMASARGDKEKSTEIGIEISKDLLDTALEHFKGIYLITPFMRYDVSVKLVEYINSKLENGLKGVHTGDIQHT